MPETVTPPPGTAPPSRTCSPEPMLRDETSDELLQSIQTPLLNTYGLAVNTKHRILVCLKCRSVIDPTNIRQHFLNQHKEFATPLDLQDLIAAESEEQYPSLTDAPPRPTEPVNPIEELGPPVMDYLLCTSCRRCYKSKESFGKHTCSSDSPQYTISPAQRWVQNNSSPWFPVKPLPAKRSTQTTPWVIFKEQHRNETSRTEKPAAQSDDFRVLHQFLKKERWLDYIEGHRHEDLMPLVKYSTLDVTYGTLCNHIHSFFSTTQSSIDSYYLRRIISVRPAQEHDEKHVRHHADVNPKTQKKYARTTAALIVFIDRIAFDDDALYKFPIATQISAACKDLIRHLLPPRGSLVEELSEGERDDEQDDNERDASDDSDKEIVIEESTRSLSQAQAPLSTSIIQQKLANLLYLLFTQTPTDEQPGKLISPIPHFVILSSLRKNGDWASGNTITPLISHLLFAGRLVFAWKIIELTKKHSMAYSSAFARVERYFDEKSEAMMPYLYLLKRGIGGVDSAEESTLYFNAPDLSGTSAIIEDKTLHLSRIGDLHQRAAHEIEQEINELTFHDPTFVISPEIHIHDDPQERASAYSFVADRRNPWNNEKTVARHILETPEIFTNYAYITPQGKVSWYPTQIAAQMKRIFKLQEKIMCNIILSYGEPARGSELASHLLANVSGGSIRNFFVLFNLPVLRASWSKTTSINNTDKPICRIPHLPIGHQLTRFLVYLRPLYLEWQKYLSPSMSFNAQHYLFAGLHRPLTSRDLSDALVAYTTQELGVPLRIRVFRQFMSFITDCNREAFTVAEANSTAMYEQFGHSAKMNLQHYTHDARVPPGMSASMFISNARVSGVFHLLFGHSPQLLEHLEYGKGRIAEVIGTISQIRHHSQPTLQSPSYPSTQVAIRDVADALKPLLLPDILRSVNKALAESTSAVIEHITPKANFQETVGPHDVIPHPHILSKLREQYPSLIETHGGFLNKEQALATQILYEGKRHLLYISPTVEKTTPGMLCAKFFDAQKSTIWILPLISLHDQIYESSKKFGLTCKSWSHSTSATNPPTNIPITIDQATFDSFKLFVSILLQNNLLARVIIDEAHLILMHGSFRPVMHLLKWLGRYPVQMVIITATLPPSLEGSLLSALGITASLTIRTVTPRPNISYNVIWASGDFDQAVVHEFEKALAHSPSSKVLLFCLTVNEAERYSQRLNVACCHSKKGRDELTVTLQKFRENERNQQGGTSNRGLVTTSILGVGLDVPNEAGRAGRPPQSTPAFSIVVLPLRIEAEPLQNPDYFGQHILHQSLQNDSQCRQVELQKFLDGSADTCTALGKTAHMCDVCSKAATSPPLREDNTPSSQLLLAAAHSSRVFTLPKNLQDEESAELESAHQIIDHYSNSCIACGLLRPPAYQDHLFRDCEHNPSPYTQMKEWQAFKSAIKYPNGVCYQCGIPQKLKYANVAGEIEYFHDYLEDPRIHCRYSDVVAGLLFTISKNKTLLQKEIGWNLWNVGLEAQQ
ncbi:hypothetical protein D9756_010117 [Leucocoprinus leucothites]|uniref:DNA 3'-5' helicase n=1 Tax=Leucocoprinus leucothites TaxID=201217 RepID=A0A8H5CWF2_9AGAR|nr:hypothetical protein D9756_010117 [Leucoagaricus leucothites]